MSDLRRWKEKVALVTGASSGIGEAVAARLAREGLRLAICARRTERLAALAERLSSEGAEVLPVTCDMRRVDQIDSLFGDIRKRFGGVDVLVNNAGLGHEAPLLDGDTELWREMLEVNVLALSVCTEKRFGTCGLAATSATSSTFRPWLPTGYHCRAGSIRRPSSRFVR